MNELWVARDDDGELCVYANRPEKMDCGSWYEFPHMQLIENWFPDLKPGECRRLVLAKETSE